MVSFWILNLTMALFLIKDWAERGQFGDMFGAVNALFSGLAFAGVIFAILLQRQEIDDQRELTARTAQTQEASTTALTEQANMLRLTAQMNGLSTIISNYEDRLARHYSSTPEASFELLTDVEKTRFVQTTVMLIRERDSYIQRLKEILDGIERRKYLPIETIDC
jgi:hypothetical protein